MDFNHSLIPVFLLQHRPLIVLIINVYFVYFDRIIYLILVYN